MLRVTKMLILHSSCWVQSLPSVHGRSTYWVPLGGPILISTRGGPIFISTGPPTDGPIPISTRGGPILIILPYPSRAGSGPGATGCLWPSGYSI